MTHRIFIGLQLPESFHKTLADWRMQHADWPVRWTKTGDLHLTLIAPWEVESVQPVINAFYTLNGFFNNQTLTFADIKFLHPDQPKMLWVEGSASPELLEMKQRLHTLLERTTEEQPFRPHVTLARCWPDEVQNYKDKTEPVNWPVTCTGLTLFESRRDQFGSRYRTLATVEA
ncbi:MAG: RNA 2',3'-cyclic phosphodiesterase [Patescibacteria group bacterium]